MSELTLYRGEVFDFIDSPSNRKDAYRYFPDGALAVRKGESIAVLLRRLKAVMAIMDWLIIPVNS